jgi:hypothetical protein
VYIMLDYELSLEWSRERAKDAWYWQEFGKAALGSVDWLMSCKK